jgi:tRNA(Ser,Leu) C12 N-acetylase TAN1
MSKEKVTKCATMMLPESSSADLQAELVETLKDFLEWNKKYPSSQIYSHYKIIQIAAELDSIAEKAKQVIEKVEAHNG